MNEDITGKESLLCGLPSWLRSMWLPPPEALPVSYPFHAPVPSLEALPWRKMNGTAHFYRANDPSEDKFDLRLPLYGMEPERGSTLIDNEENWHLVLVLLSDVTQFFWRRYGINLAALSALQAVGGISFSGMLARESVRTRVFARFGIMQGEERYLRSWPLRINVKLPESVENSCEC